MKTKTDDLINDLIAVSRKNIEQVEKLKQLGYEQLNKKSSTKSWSALECIEHLNLYGDFYTPEIEKRLLQTSYKSPTPYFKSGLLGNYFAKSMIPGENMTKMKTFKDKNPNGSNLDLGVLDKFILHQAKLIDQLEKARQVDLNKTKTSITISKWIKLKLGDTFRVVIYHNQRHILQAERAAS